MEAVVFFHKPVTEQTVSQLETCLIDLAQRGTERVTVAINSVGGNTFAGMGAYNLMRSLPMEVSTHAHGVCGSIAASMFLAGKRRTVSHATGIILHATTYSEGPLLGQQTPFTQVVAETFRNTAGWGEDLVTKYLSPGENYLSLQDSVSLNFAHAIEDLRVSQKAEIRYI